MHLQSLASTAGLDPIDALLSEISLTVSPPPYTLHPTLYTLQPTPGSDVSRERGGWGTDSVECKV